MQLLLVVGQNLDDNKVFGYKVSKPMFGTLHPRKLIDSTDILIDSLEVNIESGNIKVKSAKPIFGTELTLVGETGITIVMQYDTTVGGYVSTGETSFAQHVASHIGGVCNLKVTIHSNEITKKSKKKRKSKTKKDSDGFDYIP